MRLDKKFQTNIDVVTAARQRIRNICSNKADVVFCISGGKDSLCVHDLMIKAVRAGDIDRRKLEVVFIDEEAIYPCIEKAVLRLRKEWLMEGVPFTWYAMEYRHHNCLNMLTQDESFICFDHLKRDVWVRQPPAFAVRSDPLLRPCRDTYQEFLAKRNRGKIVVQGIRVAESVQRLKALARGSIETTGHAYPIYDWTDKDVWRYIYDNGLEFPEAYMYMYQCGVAINRLRISQFFSQDTIGSLVKMCEYYPHLFDRICRREPNAYMAMLYYDTELFRRSKDRAKNAVNAQEQINYRNKFLHLMRHPELLTIEQSKEILRLMVRLYMTMGIYWTDKEYKEAYQILIAGDPKKRSIRALWIHSAVRSKEDTTNG